MVEVFRTNIDNEKKADFILEKLQKCFPDYIINFDLEDCDNILRMETQEKMVDAAAVIVLIKEYGHQIDVLPDEIPNKDKKKKTTPSNLPVSFSLLLVILILNACGSAKRSGCIDESKISQGPCTMEYNPVCGCDGKTYGNTCQAERGGVTSWEQGECK